MLRAGLPPRFLIPALVLLALAAILPARTADAGTVNMRANPVAFSPNGDGVREVTVISWTVTDSAAASIVIKIRRSGVNPSTPALRTFDLGARPVGRDSIEWDGRDDAAVLLPDTLYAIRLTERDALGAILSQPQVAVQLDATPPIAPHIAGPVDTTRSTADYTLSGTAAGADSVILWRDGVPADTAGVGIDPPDFAFKIKLNEGDNRFSVQAFDRAGNVSPQTTEVDVHYVNTADVGLVAAVPPAFSPNGDGVLDSSRVSFSIDAPTTRLEVHVRRGPIPLGQDVTAPVTTLFDGPAAAGPKSFVWAGRDSLGAPAGEASYVFAVRAESLTAGGTPIPSTVTRYAAVTLDLTPPPAPVLDPPPPARTSRSTLVLHIRAPAADSAFVFDNGNRIARATVPGFKKEVELTVPLILGDNAFTLESNDLAGNPSPRSAPFVVLYEEPIGFHAPERFTAGDEFDVNLTSPARSVVIDLFTLRGEPVRRLVSTQSLTRYELVWNLADETGNMVGDGPYVARLTVTYPDGTVRESRGAVVVVK